MIETIEAQVREAAGTRAVMKVRGKGLVPAILYGHGEANVCLSIKEEAVASLIRHGTKLVNLVGAVKDTALLRDVQWDSLGSEIIHLDFARVSQTELVEVTLPIELHGEAQVCPKGATPVPDAPDGDPLPCWDDSRAHRRGSGWPSLGSVDPCRRGQVAGRGYHGDASFDRDREHRHAERCCGRRRSCKWRSRARADSQGESG